MVAEIISIGDEILIGQTVNTNASYISTKLTEVGVEVRWITAVGDNEDDLISTIAIAEQRADVIICTGGLGPTHDDMTKNVFTKYFDTNLILNKKLLKKVENHFKSRGIPMPIVNREQALVPQNATIIDNKVGTASGLLFEKKNTYFFILPGVPLEMKTMIDSDVIPFLKKKSTRFIKHKTIKTAGIGESALFEKLGNIEELEKYTKIAFLPKITGVEIRINAAGENEKQCMENIRKVEHIITKKISEHIWGIDDEKIEDIVANLLIYHKKTVAIVESYTGGLISDKLSNVDNWRTFLSHSVITNSIKFLMKTLDISENLLDNNNENNQTLVKEMARKIRLKYQTDYGVATLGEFDDIKSESEVAIHIAVADIKETVFNKLILKRHRTFNKQRTAQFALDLLRRQILKLKR